MKTPGIAFSASEVVTVLMALEASMFLADTIGNKAEHDEARDLRNKLVESLKAAYATAEKTGAKVH